MAKLCPKGKAAAKRKFKVYPSAYANMYASGVLFRKNQTRWKKKSYGWWNEDMTRMKYLKGGPV